MALHPPKIGKQFVDVYSIFKVHTWKTFSMKFSKFTMEKKVMKN